MWNNNMMYLFPVKVSEINDRIERKKVELELYRKIISETLGFMKQRIQETKQKQQLVNEINQYVGVEIAEALEHEQEFYEANDRDKLKTPPFVYVKRIERPGLPAFVRPPKAAGGRQRSPGRKSPKRGIRESRERATSNDFKLQDLQIDGINFKK